MYEYHATTVSVTDGDTIRLDIDLGFQVVLKNTPIRLQGIDSPEISTPEGIAARTYLRQLLPAGTKVILLSHKDKDDKYGRILGFVTIARPELIKGDLSVNLRMVDAGHAVAYMVNR